MKEEPRPKSELRETFDHFDKNKSGEVDYEEFLAILDALNFGLDPDMREMGFEIVDSNSNDRISFEEFSAWFESQ